MESVSSFYHDDEFGGESPDYEDITRGVMEKEYFNHFMEELREDSNRYGD